MPVRTLIALILIAVAAPHSAAQEIARACGGGTRDAFCDAVGAAAERALPRAALAAVGGNPIPGTASTLGFRLADAPRWSLGLRFTGVASSLPAVDAAAETDELSPFATGLGLDGAVGILQGWSPLPTVGGVGSLDVLVGVSRVGFAGGRDYADSFWSWGGGARVGLLRESFTLPGVALGATYRRLQGVRFGDEDLADAESFIAGDVNVLSARATAGKTILLLGLTGGVGWDRLSGDIRAGATGGLPERRGTAEGWSTDRMMVFGNASYTYLVLHLVLEAGWQEGADLPAGQDADDGGFFGGVSLRLSI